MKQPNNVTVTYSETLYKNATYKERKRNIKEHNICTMYEYTPPPTTAIFRTFKKSTAPYKVHNMGLRYIKNSKEFKIRANKFLTLVYL